MLRRQTSQIYVAQPIYLLLEILVRLFTLGIFSVQGGAKAWFELILVTAALCASGYILWWQVPLLIAAIILATLAAGMFSILAPQYTEAENFANKRISTALQTISEYNLNEISTLSGSRLEQRLEQLHKAQRVFENNPKLVEQISELQSVLININQADHVATERVVVQREAYARQQRKLQELEKQRKEAEERREQAEADQKRQEWKVYQEKLKREAKLKTQHEALRQAAKNKESQAAAEREAWLYEQRKRENFTGGCPPDDRFDPPRCRPGYLIKVTLNKKEDGYDGIIWKPSDKEYDSIVPKWCYSSVQEAANERGRYRFRRPMNSQGKPRP
ncbi:hypothetical protein H6F90_09070 [Trichocoleus sp. FACHB-591]|uniref:hypothetical protein n=1 Tax=Trichocoleus sp. FACHB-591 TaxID=2692872 RepID=UPI00168239EB|nr:hypothetical protein [Trichocoleus sp. FACHB-591]MBD2095308.1 hypothetical protein [Trichocoleus sp. FACHB-591]